MIVVDSGVWIDFFRGTQTAATHAFKKILNSESAEIIVPDLVLYEVLRGFRHEREYRYAQSLLSNFSIEPSFNPRLAVEAAQHFRSMVSQGFTIRSAIDVMIGAFCIEHDYTLLHSDRDFDIMSNLRGLKILSVAA